MTTDLHDDPTIARLRAADPAEGLQPRPPSRDALTAARRRRSGRRGTAGVAAAAGAALVIALAPLSGGTGGTSGPVPVPVLASAAAAAELPPNSIVVTTTDVKVRSTGKLDERRTTWVRVRDGEVLASRVLNVGLDGSVLNDSVTRGSIDGGDAVSERLDPRTGEVTTEQGSEQVPGLLFQAQALVRKAERDGKVEPATFDGRKAYSISTIGVEEAPLPADSGIRESEELLVDAETFLPLVLRKHSEGIAYDGKPFTYDYTERVVKQETLPDTAENRAQIAIGR